MAIAALTLAAPFKLGSCFFNDEISSPNVRCLLHWNPNRAVDKENNAMEPIAAGWRREPVRPSKIPQLGESLAEAARGVAAVSRAVVMAAALLLFEIVVEDSSLERLSGS